MDDTEYISKQDYAYPGSSEFSTKVAKLTNLYEDIISAEKSNGRMLRDIRVYCRVRPLSPSEQGKSNYNIIRSDEFTVAVQTQCGQKEFSYDAVFTPEYSQEQIFGEINKLIRSSVDGFKVCIFAYGQSGSGKSFTMIGDKEQRYPGIIPRSFKAIYDFIEENKTNYIFSTSICMTELYRDNLIDLLAKVKNSSNLDIRKDKSGMVVVQGATVSKANSAEQLMELFEKGLAQRHVSTKQTNFESSRSHLIVSVIIESKSKFSGEVVRGKLTLVDLAGSTRGSSVNPEHQEQLKESQCINKSLSALSDVISALSSEQAFVPYRNNKLSMLMQDSFGGNAKTVMFVNINPAEFNCDETVTALTYASRVKQITSDASRISDNKEVTKLREEIEALQAERRKDKEEIAYLRASAVEATKAELARSAELTKTIESLLNQNDNMSEELRCESKKVAELTRNVEDLIAENREINDDLNSKRERVSELTQSVEDLIKQHESTSQNYSQARDNFLTQMKALSDNFNTEQEKMIAEKKTLSKNFDNERDDLNKTIADLKSQVKKLSDSLNGERLMVAERTKSIEELKIEKTTLSANFDRESADLLSQNKKLIENFDSERQEFSKSIQDLIEKNNTERRDLTKIIEDLEAQSENQSRTSADLNAQVKILSENISNERRLRRKYYNMVEDMKGKIRVFCRVRPMSPSELKKNNNQVISCPEEDTVVVKTTRGTKDFQFNAVFTPEHSQEDVFKDISRLIQSAVDGYNVCVFAHGQTGSGKTFTMVGDKEQKHPGIIPRSFQAIYDLIEEDKNNLTFSTSMYMLELYRDNLIDLFTAEKYPATLEIRKDKKQRMVVVQGAVIKEANSAEELMELFEAGSASRHLASTKMNRESSRSHLVTSLIIQSTNKTTGSVVRGKISFVDLAGSNRAAKTESTPEQLKEAQSINKSLNALGDVVSALSTEQSFIPYRNDKLTMLMQDSLGGNAKTLMFVNISPAEYNCDETVTSLTYASRVKLIMNDINRTTDIKAEKSDLSNKSKNKEG